VVAIPWLSANGADLLSLGETAEVFGGAILFAALGGALGAALGALVRNQVAAVVGFLIFLFVLDPTLSALVEDAAPWTLSGLSSSLTGGDDGGIDTFSRGVAALIWLCYTAVIAGGAAFVTARRDI
jgi:hypothetical protein